MISINTCGGLGNVMFQVAVGYSTSIDQNCDFIADASEHFGAHYPLEKYQDNIFKNIKFSREKITCAISTNENEYEHRILEYKKLSTDVKSLKLFGYFQSEKYFKHNKDKLLKLYENSENTKNKVLEKYHNILVNNKTCSLHVRRGDYLHLQTHHPVLPLDYYKKSYDIISENSVYLIFSDDLEYCKNNFNFIKEKIVVDDLEDYEELYLMSLCNDNIIANSTFSWWGAWMNKNSNIVISPKKWFGEALRHHATEELYCDNWLII